MTPARPLPALVAVCRAVLEPIDFERMVQPAIADAVHERGPVPADLRWHAGLSLQLLGVVGLASAMRWLDAALGTRWYAFGAAVLAGAAGVVGLSWGPSGSRFATLQLVWLVVGAAAGVFVATAPPRWLAGVARLAAVLCGLGLLAVPWWGTSFEGARRWLTLGPLTVQSAILALPVFAAVMAHGAARWNRSAVWLVWLVVGALLCAQPDAAAVLIYSVTAIAATRRTRASAVLSVLAVGCSAVALLRHVPPRPVLHVEQSAAVLAAAHAAWFALGICAVLLVGGLGLRAWLTVAGQQEEAARRCEPWVAAGASGLAALIVVPWLLRDGAVPWISYGGSAATSAFVLTSMVLRAERAALAHS